MGSAVIVDWFCGECRKGGFALVLDGDEPRLRVHIAHKAAHARKRSGPCPGRSLVWRERRPVPGKVER